MTPDQRIRDRAGLVRQDAQQLQHSRGRYYSAIRQALNEGHTLTEVAEWAGVSKQRIAKIRDGGK